ncbi:MAG: hypothetical protein L0226_08495 [Acidobacteria bacterium]|nr:hypothetical protein [Acidobacteriota bacterium]
MTTLVVVRKNGRACIAADSLTSWGSTLQSSNYLASNSKIIKVGDSFIGTTGIVTHRFVIESYFSGNEKYSFRSKQEIFETCVNFINR